VRVAGLGESRSMAGSGWVCCSVVGTGRLAAGSAADPVVRRTTNRRIGDVVRSTTSSSSTVNRTPPTRSVIRLNSVAVSTAAPVRPMTPNKPAIQALW